MRSVNKACFLQEFIEQFRVLLPKNTASLEDISSLLHKLGFDNTTYQIGKTKVWFSVLVLLLNSDILLRSLAHIVCVLQVYLKELERQKLQDILHKDVMHKIIFLQRWFRAKMQRWEFIRMREAAVLIQVYHNLWRVSLKGLCLCVTLVWSCLQRSWRRYHKERFYRAAILIQAAWRGSRQREDYQKARSSVTKIQALVRGHSARKRCALVITLFLGFIFS